LAWRTCSVAAPQRSAGVPELRCGLRIWTQDDAAAARVMSQVWRWRIDGMLLIVGAVLLRCCSAIAAFLRAARGTSPN
jgi:hypothetical protein